jgi:hypothetical protein
MREMFFISRQKNISQGFLFRLARDEKHLAHQNIARDVLQNESQPRDLFLKTQAYTSVARSV